MPWSSKARAIESGEKRLPLASGGLLVTVSRNSLISGDSRRDANLYMPQFLEVAPADVGGHLLPTQWT